MKYLFALLVILSCADGTLEYLSNNMNGFQLCLLSAITSAGVYAILSQLQKNNKGVTRRDPKTGRFIKK